MHKISDKKIEARSLKVTKRWNTILNLSNDTIDISEMPIRDILLGIVPNIMARPIFKRYVSILLTAAVNALIILMIEYSLEMKLDKS